MNRVPPNPAVLCQLYLDAVLPCLSELVAEDAFARDLTAGLNASIVFRVAGGPARSVHLRDGAVSSQPGSCSHPSIVLLFLSRAHLNAFFSGRKWALPLLAWGGWRIRVLKGFSTLAERLEAVLEGHEAVISTAAGRRLHARLSLMAAGLGLPSLAAGDVVSREAFRSLPYGMASFTISSEQGATVWFDRQLDTSRAGWSAPPRQAEVCIAFGDAETAFAAMRDQIDTMAATASGQIVVDGLIPLADGLNFIMQRLRVYLQPSKS
ncbi:MAG TPA: hypothetical protein VNZ06_14940 [Steroidobacteraceae bacterium]|jgi:hypothetical protein|nr:hypothetical protein [Steroidobacteraceae bacterium]